MEFTVVFVKAFLGPKRLLKTQVFEKKAIFLVKRRFWHIFARIIKQDIRQEIFFWGPQAFLTITVELKRAF